LASASKQEKSNHVNPGMVDRRPAHRLFAFSIADPFALSAALLISAGTKVSSDSSMVWRRSKHCKMKRLPASIAPSSNGFKPGVV
jgi:hypothetical protein